ncbi:hypothetical protein [Phaeobacter inhibens]|uniref:hypothetical protein n=2 Tax=Phaeobacter inhibens TaxID=221822 RepID=UPI000CA1725E|nr:hypothetical protein [Phaeobacter inhibens]AUQ72893.1 hypothetical protein PhaeoP54_04062 [Phaeobacter inhibens]
MASTAISYRYNFKVRSIMNAIFKILVCAFVSTFFTTCVDAQTQLSPQASTGCKIFSTGEREAKYICSELKVSLEEALEFLVLSIEHEPSIISNLILEEREIQPIFVEKFLSSMWVLENCEAKEACAKPSAEQTSLSTCEGEMKMYTLYRGFFLQDYPPLKTLEIGKSLLCASNQGLNVLISADLFATDQDAFVILPVAAKNGEK